MSRPGSYALPQPVSVEICVSRSRVDAVVSGDTGRMLYGVSSIDNAGPGDLCFCSAAGVQALERLERCQSDAVIVRDDLALRGNDNRTLILTRDPLLLFAKILADLFPRGEPPGVDPQAVVHPGALVDPAAIVGPFAVVERASCIGSGAVVGSGCQVREGSILGRNVRLAPTAVVGADGLAYGTELDGGYFFLRHLGCAILEDDVDVGAGSVIVRGILENTVIGRGTKIGNNVSIGHNVSIGVGCFISSGAVLCGSVVVEDRCWIAPGVVVLNHVRVGTGAKLAIGSVVTKDVPPGAVVAGHPARVVSTSHNSWPRQ